jgi:hypothetical protein
MSVKISYLTLIVKINCKKSDMLLTKYKILLPTDRFRCGCKNVSCWTGTVHWQEHGVIVSLERISRGKCASFLWGIKSRWFYVFSCAKVSGLGTHTLTKLAFIGNSVLATARYHPASEVDHAGQNHYQM